MPRKAKKPARKPARKAAKKPARKAMRKAAPARMPRLLEFYGRECPHCLAMMPLVKQLEKETGLHVQQYEVWHDPRNADMLRQYDKGFCGGVPFFYNESTHEWLCGAQDYQTLKDWAIKGWKKR